MFLRHPRAVVAPLSQHPRAIVATSSRFRRHFACPHTQAALTRGFTVNSSTAGSEQVSRTLRLTIGKAKDFAMVERADKGNRARPHFIECKSPAKHRLSSSINSPTRNRVQRRIPRANDNLLASSSKLSVYPIHYNRTEPTSISHLGESLSCVGKTTSADGVTSERLRPTTRTSPYQGAP